MAIRLPDANTLGRPNFGGARPRASIDGTAIGEGIERAGRAVTQAGERIERGYEAQGRAVEQGGLAQSRAVESVGKAAGSAVTQAGESMGNAIYRGGAGMADAINAAARQDEAAAKSLGTGLEKLGKGVQEWEEERAKLDFYRARADFVTRRAAIDTKFDKDTDYTTMPTRYREAIGQAAEQSATLVNNPRYRELFGAYTQTDMAHAARNADRQAFRLEAKDRVVELGQRLDGLRDSALVTREEDRAKTIDIANGYIDQAARAGYIDPGDVRSTKQKWAVDYTEASLRKLPAEQRVKMLQRGPQNEEEFLDRVTGVESAGGKRLKNPNSSATGPDQFIEQTWLGTLKKYGPAELGGQIQTDANGRHFVADKAAEQQILNLRNDPKLSREMTRALSRENGEALRSAGISPSADNLYLAHFLGAGDAIKVLKADPATPVAELLSAKVIAANAQVLSGKTAGTVAQWAGQKMGVSGPSNTFIDFLPEARRDTLLQQSRQEVQQIQTVQSSQRSEQFTRAIIDASAGISALPERKLIENDPLLTPEKRNTLLKAYDSAAGDVATFQRVLGQFNNPAGGPFNPFDKTETDAIDKIFRGLGGNPAALQRVVERTGIVPPSVATNMRADIASTDPKRIATSATLARNMQKVSPAIFTGVTGGKDIEEAAVTFGHYVDEFGMTAEQAAKKIVESNTPEYQAAKKAKIKGEDIDTVIRKKVTINDLRGAFDTISVVPFTDPQVGASEKAREKMFNDYAELTREYYLDGRSAGDIDLAKKLAANQLKTVWGVSKVNGSVSGVLMPYAPERMPRLANVENASELIADHAIESIRTETGQTVDRKSLALIPVPQTAQAHKSGAPVPYLLMWTDKNGVPQIPQRTFVVDPAQLLEMQMRKRQAGFDAGVAAAGPSREAVFGGGTFAGQGSMLGD